MTQAIQTGEAPSASQLSRRILDRLTTEIPESDIVRGIREMLNASYVTKSGKEHPDFRAREAGIRLYLSYTVGLPLQRQIVANIAAEGSEDRVEDRLMASPAARIALKEMLIKAGEEM